MIKNKIFKDIQFAFEDLNFELNENFTVEIPNNVNHGDYSTNACLISAKPNKMSPRIIAEQVIEKLKTKKMYKDIEIAGPGFINFHVKPSYFKKIIVNVNEEGDDYGRTTYGKGSKILIEFISANPTGPLNIVSARAAAYGDSLYRIMSFAGFRPIREFYINDAGNQVDILAESLELRYRELHNEDIGEFPVEAYHGEYITELAALLNTTEGSKLLHISERDRLQKMKEFALSEIHKMQVESLEKFDVQFDNWVSEKSLRAQGVVEEVLSFLAEADCTFEMEEAIWFNSTKFGDDKNRVLMKADGTITYIVPDLAYHLTKLQRGNDVLIDVLGPDHHGYVPRLRAGIQALGYDDSCLEVIFLQQVNLFDQGEKIKMSKRLGKMVTMDDLIDEVGKDAARFFFINRKPSAHLNFDLDLATKKTSENPVFYCQYAHARICSIIKKAEKDKLKLADFDEKYLKKLNKDDEMLIMRKLGDFQHVLCGIADSREPHRLAEYLTDLAGMFHKYYQKYTISNKRYKELSIARLYLINAVRIVLKNALNLLGVSAPTSM